MDFNRPLHRLILLLDLFQSEWIAMDTAAAGVATKPTERWSALLAEIAFIYARLDSLFSSAGDHAVVVDDLLKSLCKFYIELHLRHFQLSSAGDLCRRHLQLDCSFCREFCHGHDGMLLTTDEAGLDVLVSIGSTSLIKAQSMIIRQMVRLSQELKQESCEHLIKMQFLSIAAEIKYAAFVEGFFCSGHDEVQLLEKLFSAQGVEMLRPNCDASIFGDYEQLLESTSDKCMALAQSSVLGAEAVADMRKMESDCRTVIMAIHATLQPFSCDISSLPGFEYTKGFEVIDCLFSTPDKVNQEAVVDLPATQIDEFYDAPEDSQQQLTIPQVHHFESVVVKNHKQTEFIKPNLPPPLADEESQKVSQRDTDDAWSIREECLYDGRSLNILSRKFHTKFGSMNTLQGAIGLIEKNVGVTQAVASQDPLPPSKTKSDNFSLDLAEEFRRSDIPADNDNAPMTQYPLTQYPSISMDVGQLPFTQYQSPAKNDSFVMDSGEDLSVRSDAIVDMTIPTPQEQKENVIPTFDIDTQGNIHTATPSHKGNKRARMSSPEYQSNRIESQPRRPFVRFEEETQNRQPTIVESPERNFSPPPNIRRNTMHTTQPAIANRPVSHAPRSASVSNAQNLSPRVIRKIPWAEPEVLALEEGLGRYGRQWSRILREFAGSFNPVRSSVDLKDKARNEKRRLIRSGQPTGVWEQG